MYAHSTDDNSVEVWETTGERERYFGHVEKYVEDSKRSKKILVTVFHY